MVSSTVCHPPPLTPKQGDKVLAISVTNYIPNKDSWLQAMLQCVTFAHPTSSRHKRLIHRPRNTPVWIGQSYTTPNYHSQGRSVMLWELRSSRSTASLRNSQYSTLLKRHSCTCRAFTHPKMPKHHKDKETVLLTRQLIQRSYSTSWALRQFLKFSWQHWEVTAPVSRSGEKLHIMKLISQYGIQQVTFTAPATQAKRRELHITAQTIPYFTAYFERNISCTTLMQPRKATMTQGSV